MWKRPLMEASLWEWWVGGGWRMKVRWWWWWWWWWWWLRVFMFPTFENRFVLLNTAQYTFASSTSISGPHWSKKPGEMDSWRLSFPNVDETFCIWLLRFTLPPIIMEVENKGPGRWVESSKRSCSTSMIIGRKSTYCQLTESFVKLFLLAYLLVVPFVDSYCMLLMPSLCSYRLEIFLWFPRIECLIIQAERRQVLDVPAPHLDLSPYRFLRSQKKQQDVGWFWLQNLEEEWSIFGVFGGLLLFSEFFYCSCRVCLFQCYFSCSCICNLYHTCFAVRCFRWNMMEDAPCETW